MQKENKRQMHWNKNECYCQNYAHFRKVRECDKKVT